MKQTLYIIRGLPGSGKSTLADKIVKSLGHDNAVKIEADQFFMWGNDYNFDHRFLGAAHDHCYGRTFYFLKNGYSVAVANTFTTCREVDSYTFGVQKMGLGNLVNIKIIVCNGGFKSVHGVPEETIKKMAERWEDIEGEIKFNDMIGDWSMQ